ncbi:MAG: hypothetical protein PVI03_05310 [Candidatus Thorarchaeota archaeon]|jgi:hypothetical protein
MTSKGFLGLDMALVRDVTYLLAEEIGEHGALETKDLIWILGKKGYGRDKVRHTLDTMVEHSLLVKKMYNFKGRRFWKYRLSASWDYVAKFFKSARQWEETAPLFNDIRKDYEILKTQGFTEREKGVVC